MHIGELATHTGCSVRAIRHYDRTGVLSSTRQDNGYRTFTPEDITRVHLIRMFLSAGFTLDEIRQYAPCWQTTPHPDTPPNPEQTATFYRRKLHDIDQQISDLHVIRDRLTTQLHHLTRPGTTCTQEPTP